MPSITYLLTLGFSFFTLDHFLVYFSLCMLVSAGTRSEDRKWLVRLGMSKLKEL
jgi:hypothetical protein